MFLTYCVHISLIIIVVSPSSRTDVCELQKMLCEKWEPLCRPWGRGKKASSVSEVP